MAPSRRPGREVGDDAIERSTGPVWGDDAVEPGGGSARWEAPRDIAETPSDVLWLSLELFAHDVRGALAASQMAVAHVAQTAEAPTARLLDAVTADLQGVDRLLTELLDLERLCTGSTEAMPVDEVVRDVVAACSEPGKVSVLAMPSKAVVDPYLLRRAIHNLVENALRHAADEVSVHVGPSLDGTVVLVDDDGLGIPRGLRDVVFEPLARLEPSDGKGIGLGLTFTRRAVELLRGRVWVESSPSGGARFCVWLP